MEIYFGVESEIKKYIYGLQKQSLTHLCDTEVKMT